MPLKNSIDNQLNTKQHLNPYCRILKNLCGFFSHKAYQLIKNYCCSREKCIGLMVT